MKIDLTEKVYAYIPDSEKCYQLNKKYVLQVIAPQPEGNVGGSDTHVLQLSKQQKESSSFAPIVLFKRNSKYEKKLFNNNIAYICGIYATDEEIAKALCNIKNIIDIAIIHSHQYDANFLAQTIKINCDTLKNIPVVMTCHGWIENTENDRKETLKDFASYRYANALITVCQKDANRLYADERFTNKKIYCINNGVEIPTFNNTNLQVLSFKQTWGIPPQTKVIAFVGRLAFEKRVDLIIRTFNKLLEQRSDTYLLIVGNGYEYENLKKIVDELKINDKVIFTGFIENPYRVYLTIDFLILMSDTEGTPRCVLECMACGKMAITTNVGGLKEIIDSGVNGVVLDDNSIEHWANTINGLLNNSRLRKKMNFYAKEKVKSIFSIKDMCEKVETVYLSLGV